MAVVCGDSDCRAMISGHVSTRKHIFCGESGGMTQNDPSLQTLLRLCRYAKVNTCLGLPVFARSLCGLTLGRVSKIKFKLALSSS